MRRGLVRSGLQYGSARDKHQLHLDASEVHGRASGATDGPESSTFVARRGQWRPLVVGWCDRCFSRDDREATGTARGGGKVAKRQRSGPGAGRCMSADIPASKYFLTVSA